MALVPITLASLMLMTAGGVSLAFGGDRIVHHVFALAKLETAKLLLLLKRRAVAQALR
jgi:hypothetical protein